MNTDAHGTHSAVIFDRERALKYDTNVHLAMAGFRAMYQVVAEVQVAALGGPEAASLLVVGIGTATEVLPFAQIAGPGFRFTGVDPSPEMVALAREKLAAEGLLERTSLHVCEIGELPRGELFDGAQMMGVLHHLPGDEARIGILREIAARLKPGAPFVMGCRAGNVPILRAVEERRSMSNGVPPEMMEQRRKILNALKVPSEEEVFGLLSQAGFVEPRFVFGEMHFKVWVTRYEPSTIGA
ncbi:class I SAM-dependent methyltransferase [Polyangium sp. 6x1]|uniref:class I SAM-dependent methyltransferase n=1 Tax=Polyangium sp. 6x1 TaxID=3042689 RepID=UPI002482F774|nr:class I SAM-dependent methyltransferase [Polyangium sp. 6x1]MDI1445962.1 class I SAM-dependent methyltransferase [Polyangium sp. 6x1]